MKWFDVPLKKYHSFPRKLIGHHDYAFRDRKGRFCRFRKGRYYTLYLTLKSETAFLDWLLQVYPPKAKFTLPKPPPLPKGKAKAKAAREKRKPLLWVPASSVIMALEDKYDGMTLDKEGLRPRGYFYCGKGPYNQTFWDTQEIRPGRVRSLVIYAVKDMAVYKIRRGTATCEHEYVLCGMQIDWVAHTDHIMRQLLSRSDEDRMDENGVPQPETKLAALAYTLFGKTGGTESVVYIVGLRFRYDKAPKRHKNPKRRKK